MLTFPSSLIPDFIDIDSTGEFGVLVSVDETGSERRVTEEDFAVGFILNVKFNYLRSDEFDCLVSFFNVCQSSGSSFNLSNLFFDLCQADWEKFIREAVGNTKWRFLDIPDVELVYNKLYNSSFKLVNVKGEVSDIVSGSESAPSWVNKLNNNFLCSDFFSIPLPPIRNGFGNLTSNSGLVWEVNDITINDSSVFINSKIFGLSFRANNVSFLGLQNFEVITPFLDFFDIADVSWGEIRETITLTFEIEVKNVGIGNDLSTIITQNITVESNNTYFADTRNGTFTVTLPPFALDNDWVRIIDFAGNNPQIPTGFGLNKLIIVPSLNQDIQLYDEIIIDQENFAVLLIFVQGSWKLAGGAS